MNDAEAKARAHLKKGILRGEGSYPKKLKAEPYLEQLRLLQIELLKMQQWVKETGARVCVLFEGRDAAGKGGAISRFTANINPRGARVVALAKPSDVERTQWYFQRYVAELPSGGEIVLFDRSWYNRAVVERVMGFCTPEQYATFIRQVPAFERMLVDDGIHLVKLWFALGRDEQKERFEARRNDPLKRWKISPVDEVAVEKYDDYTDAVADMMLLTDTDQAPWTVINGNEKRRARLAAIAKVLGRVPYEPKETALATPDPKVAAPAAGLFDDAGFLIRRRA
jgi:polyphosphate kinase 2